jgi:hypothetical protein
LVGGELDANAQPVLAAIAATGPDYGVIPRLTMHQ